MSQPASSPPVRPAGRPLDEIEIWIFDLDNTLYPGSCALYREIEARMADFIMAELSLDRATAQALRRRFYMAHGTTLRGLMNEYRIAPHRFLEYVHEIDLSPVASDPALGMALAELPGRKLIFTNGTVRHAERVLARLGLAEHFSVIHDIAACDYVPKPDPSIYRDLIRRHDIDPQRAIMIEDMARNLPPAAALGMTTVWVQGGPHAEDDGHGAHIHHTVAELAPWLAKAARPKPVEGEDER